MRTFYRCWLPLSALISLLLFTQTASIAQKSLKNVRTVTALKAVNEKVFFAATDNVYGEELWVSDGTSDGTKLVKDINPGYYSSTPSDMTSYKGLLYFTAYTRQFERELWKSDGTPEGTEMVVDLAPLEPYYGGGYPMPIRIFKDHLYFTTAQGGLYKSDGTQAGTVLIDEMANSRISMVTTGDNYLYYFKGTEEIQRTDGTNLSSVPIPTDTEDNYFMGVYTAGDKLFAVRASSQYQQIKLYSYDETAGWLMLKEFKAPIYGDQEIENFTAIGNKLFFNFRTDYENVAPTDELWITDGSVSGTTLLKSFGWSPHFSGSEMGSFIELAGTLFFRASNSASNALWRSDGTPAGTVKVHDVKIMPVIYNVPNPPAVSNGKLWFCGQLDLSDGNGELWSSDGTSSGTTLYADLVPAGGSFPYLLTTAQNDVYFITGTSYTSTTLWSTASAPEIDVTGGMYGSQIPNGGSLFLNNIKVGECLKTKVSIENPGHKEIVVSKIEVTGSDFFVKGQLPESIPPKGKVTIDVIFVPSSMGKKEAEINIFSNDQNEPQYTVKLVGETVNSDTKGVCHDFSGNFTKVLLPNEGDELIELSNQYVKEKLPVSSLIGTLSVPNFSGGVTYSFIAGDGDEDNNDFILDGNHLRTKKILDYSVKNTYVVRIKATTAESIREELFTIVVEDIPAAAEVANPCPDAFEYLSYGLMDMETNSAGHLYSITDNGKILRSKDEGVSWELAYSGPFGRLNSIKFNNGKGYIMGDYVVLKSDDDGESWFQLYIPFVNGPKWPYSATFLDEERWFVANGFGEIFYTDDGGNTWEKRFSDLYQEIRNPWFWNNSNGMAMSGRSGIIRTSDGGKTWQGVEISQEWNPTWTALYFINSNDGFLTSNQQMYRTKDGGKTWTTVSEVWSQYLYGIDFVDDKNGFVYGGNGGGLIWVTNDGGESWEMNFNLGPGMVTGIAKTHSGKLLTTHITHFSSSFSSGHAVNISTDNGSTWELLNGLTDQSFGKLDFVSETVGYLWGETGLFKTTDKGVTWKRFNWSRPIYSTYYFDENNALLSDGFVIYKTTDGGNTMEEVFATTQDPDNYVPVGILYGVNENLIFSYSTSALYRSLNSGEDWELMNTDETSYFKDLQFLSATTGYRLGLFGHTQKTTNGGATWTEIYTPAPEAADTYSSIYFIDTNIGYRAGEFFEKTTDGGVTWTRIFTIFYSDIADLHFTDALHGYASGRTRILYETFDGGLTWAEKWNGGSSDGLHSVQFKHGNMYLVGDRGFVGQIREAGKAPLQPGYVFGSNQVCVGDVHNYKLADNYTGTYQWNTSAGVISDNGSIAQVRFPQAGEYSLTVKNINNCGISETRSFTVKAIELDEPVINGPDLITESASVRYDFTNAEQGVDYTWNVIGAKTFTTDGNDHSIVAWKNDAEEASVNIMGTDLISGCRIFGALDVDVDIILGVEKGSEKISIYPNPTHGEVVIRYHSGSPERLRVVDIMGREHLTKNVGTFQESHIDLRSLPAGLYILEISDRDGNTTETKKLIKK